MTLGQIEALANAGNIASGAFNIHSKLRFEVVPEFYRRLSDVTWLRRNRSVSVIPPSRTYDLPRDFASMILVGTVYAEVRYIGEDPGLVAAAELNTTVSAPKGYYLVPSSDGLWRGIKFDAPPYMEYTVPYVYLSELVLLNDAEDIELDPFIPRKYQPALIQGLKREIYDHRYGQGDQRFVVAAQAFLEIVEQAKEGGHDMARRNYAVYCD